MSFCSLIPGDAVRNRASWKTPCLGQTLIQNYCVQSSWCYSNSAEQNLTAICFLPHHLPVLQSKVSSMDSIFNHHYYYYLVHLVWSEAINISPNAASQAFFNTELRWKDLFWNRASEDHISKVKQPLTSVSLFCSHTENLLRFSKAWQGIAEVNRCWPKIGGQRRAWAGGRSCLFFENQSPIDNF